MKILIVTGIFPPDHGGPATYVPAIAQALSDAGHQLLGVVTLSDSLDHDDSGYPFPVFRILRGIPRVLRAARTVLTLRRLGRDADVVYLNGLVLEGVLACKVLSNRPLVAKVVGDLIWERARSGGLSMGVKEFQSARVGAKYGLLKRLQRWYMCRVDLIIVPSQFLRHHVVGAWLGSDQNLRVVHNAVEKVADTAPAPSEHYDFDVVSVGRLIEIKRMDALIRICAANGWRLRIVGDGPLADELKRQAQKLTREGMVSFDGYVPKAAVPKLIASAKVFALASTHDSFPHVLLEAKAAGIPVVATRVGGIPEQINDGVDGLLVPPGDDEAMAEAIRALLGDSDLRRRLAEAGQAQVRREFSWTALVAQTEAVLAAAAGLQRRHA